MLLIKFNHIVMSLLRVWKMRLQGTQNLMTALKTTTDQGVVSKYTLVNHWLGSVRCMFMLFTEVIVASFYANLCQFNNY